MESEVEGGVPKLAKPFGTDLLLGKFVRGPSIRVFFLLRPLVGLSEPPFGEVPSSSAESSNPLSKSKLEDQMKLIHFLFENNISPNLYFL
jgi:hypothetical protein